MLDVDKDGRIDRAVLTRHDADASADLSIYFGAGNDTAVGSASPRVIRSSITPDTVIEIAKDRNGTLTLRHGCGGCSNDYETELRLVYRDGQIVVRGYSVDWDTRSGIGRCDVDLLKGEGVVTRGLGGRGVTIKIRARPIALSAWSEAMVAKSCK